MYISKDKFKHILTEKPLDNIVSTYILESTPQIFKKDFEAFLQWKRVLSEKIKVDSKCIVIIGGANIGFSLNPSKKMKTFDSISDIDVAIVSSFYFNMAWRYLQQLGLSWHDWEPKAKSALEDHRTRLIYWGTIATDKIIQYLPFGKEWVLLSDEMKEVLPTDKREINFRLYKDFESLRIYQKNGLEKLRTQIIEEAVS